MSVVGVKDNNMTASKHVYAKCLVNKYNTYSIAIKNILSSTAGNGFLDMCQVFGQLLHSQDVQIHIFHYKVHYLGSFAIFVSESIM